MKIVTVIGARPQFIKAAAVSRLIRSKNKEILIHTGQHYDQNMSDIFFEELEIPRPDYQLGVGSGSHAVQTAAMLTGIEDILIKEEPNYIMVYGDTNSTLAGALAAVKLHIPIIHVEAGLRSYNMNMPEEINRILTDRISSLLFCPTQTASDNLRAEGISEGIYCVGDVMCDAVLCYSEKLESLDAQYFWERLRGLFYSTRPMESWYLATVHRVENTDTPKKIKEILGALERLNAPVIFPVHPRTKPLVEHAFHEYHYDNIIFVEPIGYLDMLYYTKNAVKVITDSGGLQKEAYILKTPCVTVREQTEWIETLKGNYNVLAKADADDIYDKVLHTEIQSETYLNYYGYGDAAKRICEVIENG